MNETILVHINVSVVFLRLVHLLLMGQCAGEANNIDRSETESSLRVCAQYTAVSDYTFDYEGYLRAES